MKMGREWLSYPINTKKVLRKKLELKQELLSNGQKRIKKRIAVLGGSTTGELVDQLELFLLNQGIQPVFYQSGYAQYWEDAVFGNEILDCFHPDVVYIHTCWRNIREFPESDSTAEQVETMLQKEYKRLEQMWGRLAERYRCPVIQNNFDRPPVRLFGNADISDYRGKGNFISRLNQYLYQYAQTREGFYVHDLEYLAASYGLDAWNDPFFWHMYKCSPCLDAVPILAKSIADIIKSLYGKNRKVLALDLDETLWGGVVGEDGPEGLKLGPETPQGQTYCEFQKYIKDLKGIGVLLAVNSKNEEENALAGLNHPDSVLNPGDFASIRANWNNKDENLKAIADELNLGLDSFVFLDDNPTEQELIRQTLSEVAVPPLEQVEQYLQLLDHSGFFEVTSLSEDDRKRTGMYQANQERTRLEQTMASYEDFLKSLEMRAVIRPFEPIYVQRIAQLTNKSNQFNLTTLRCSENDITNMMEDRRWLCRYGKLSDRFGDNGVVSVVAGEKEGKSLHLRLWLMSCRVLKKGMEMAMLDALAQDAEADGITSLIGYYYPTAKNGMVKDFYRQMGFEPVRLSEDGTGIWKLELAAYRSRNLFIEVSR